MHSKLRKTGKEEDVVSFNAEVHIRLKILRNIAKNIYHGSVYHGRDLNMASPEHSSHTLSFAQKTLIST
jgi:hypothetical protein